MIFKFISVSKQIFHKNMFQRICKILIISILSIVSYSSLAQKMLENRFAVHGGLGTGIYLASTNQKEDKDNAALAGSTRLGIEYAFSPRFIAGISIFRNGFATDKDSNTTVSNGNFSLTAQYLLIGKEYSGLYLSGGLGLSALSYNNQNKMEEGNTSGIFLMLGIRYQRFFGDNLGWFLEAATAGYQYKKLEAKYAGGIKSTNEKWEMGITGGELKLGLIWVFGKKA